MYSSDANYDKKEFSTTEELVQQTVDESRTFVNERRIIPKRQSTVVRKLMAKNPWRAGSRIAKVFEDNWDDINNVANTAKNRSEFILTLQDKPYIIDLSKSLYLDTNWMVSGIVEDIS